MKRTTDDEMHVEITPTMRRGMSRLHLMSSMLGGVLIGAVACSSNGSSLPPAGAAGSTRAGNEGPTPSDNDILNFALNLEYLEAEFYSLSVTGKNISANGVAISGAGTPGPTTGGGQVNFTDTTTKNIAAEIQQDEMKHVNFLRGVLGSAAIAKPAINLDALGTTTGQMAQFLVLSRAFEDTGVSAYAGAATLISSKGVLGPAAQILATEAYHAGAIRTLISQMNISCSSAGLLDAQDILPPPSGRKYFPTDNNGLAIARTAQAVLAIVKPFFPNGLNGNIR